MLLLQWCSCTWRCKKLFIDITLLSTNIVCCGHHMVNPIIGSRCIWVLKFIISSPKIKGNKKRDSSTWSFQILRPYFTVRNTAQHIFVVVNQGSNLGPAMYSVAARHVIYCSGTCCWTYGFSFAASERVSSNFTECITARIRKMGKVMLPFCLSVHRSCTL